MMMETMGDPALLEKAWLGLLAVPGTLLFERLEKGAKLFGYVCSSSPYGVKCWDVTTESLGSKRFVKFANKPPFWKYAHITDAKKWLCQETSGLAPCQHSGLGVDGLDPKMRVYVSGAVVMSLSRGSALTCFKGITSEFLKNLLFELEVDMPLGVPKLEVERA